MFKATTLRDSIETATAMGQNPTVRVARGFPHLGLRDCKITRIAKNRVWVRDIETGKEWATSWAGIGSIVVG